MDPLDEERRSIAENKPSSVQACVTEPIEGDSGLDKSSSLSDDLHGKQGSKDNSKKEATEHDEADIVDVKASSSSKVISGLSTLAEVCGEVADPSPSNTNVTAPHTLVQSNDCVRTVAETSPMPDLFAQDDDGDT